jgi:hypothetical protein
MEGTEDRLVLALAKSERKRERRKKQKYRNREREARKNNKEGKGREGRCKGTKTNSRMRRNKKILSKRRGPPISDRFFFVVVQRTFVSLCVWRSV